MGIFGIGVQEIIVAAIVVGIIWLLGDKILLKGYDNWLGFKNKLKTVQDKHIKEEVAKEAKMAKV